MNPPFCKIQLTPRLSGVIPPGEPGWVFIGHGTRLSRRFVVLPSTRCSLRLSTEVLSRYYTLGCRHSLCPLELILARCFLKEFVTCKMGFLRSDIL